MRRTAVACVAFWLVSALFVGIGGLRAATPEDHEAGLVGRIGDERAAAGLGGYVVAPDLVDVARRHAEEMRRQQRLHHNPSLGDDVQGWQAVGENVGVGPSVEEIHRKLMASPSHRDNILSARFTEVGVGVVVDGADLWIVQVFRLPESAAAQPAPAPAAEPAPPAEGPPAGAEPAPAPEARPAPAPAPAPAGGTVRAANAGSGSTGTAPAAPPATSPPAPPTTIGATASTVATSAPEVPTSLLEANPSTAGASATISDASSAAAGIPAGTVADLDLRAPSTRTVTWPVGVAATMLLGVVTALTVHVGGAKVRAVARAGKRPSLLDVWELALAG